MGLRSNYISIINKNSIKDLDADFKVFSEAKIPGDHEWYWLVKSRCSALSCQPKAYWMAGVFTSAFRLGLQANSICFRAGNGQVEPHPDSNMFNTVPFLCGEHSGNTFYQDSGGKPSQYWVDAPNKADFYREDFQDKINKIFQRKKGTISESLYYSLGWLASARQSYDRAHRVVLYFTALESFLNVGKGLPISDTISRFSSCIITDLSNNREKYYNKIKYLYKIRSKITHAGVREVEFNDLIAVEDFINEVFRISLYLIDIEMPMQEFHEHLRSSTHGIDLSICSRFK